MLGMPIEECRDLQKLMEEGQRFWLFNPCELRACMTYIESSSQGLLSFKSAEDRYDPGHTGYIKASEAPGSLLVFLHLPTGNNEGACVTVCACFHGFVDTAIIAASMCM